MDLTRRELEIVLLAADGLTDKEIGNSLGIARSTVITHWGRMRTRFEASSRGELIAKAMATIYRETRTEVEKLGEIYRVMVDSLEDFAVFLFDPDRKAISWNPGMMRILGFDEGEWIGQIADVIFTPEDCAKGMPRIEQETAEREGKAIDERWHLKKDGSRFWSSGVVTPIRLGGATVCYAKILRDLTRMKRLEDQIRALGGTPE